ncbi:MAG: ATP-binding cassette domain-containing protein [Mobilitalea sp.]
MSLSVDITKKHKNFVLSVKFDTANTTLGILGASGCGKSMTLKAIAGIITPDSGRIVLNDKVLFDSQLKINLMPQKRKVGYLFQNYALFPNMTVEQNIAAGINGKASEKKAKVDELIDAFHLTKRKEQYPSQLSGGQQQRVALARILASDTDILLLDEPFSALDYYLKEQLQEQMLKMIHNYNKDVIMVTHNRDEAFRFCPDLLVMDHGNIVCEGKLKDIFKDPKYLVAARLTGCKNFSRAEKVSEHEIYAADWEMRLHMEEPITEQLSHVGIRAHYVNALPEINENKVNIFEPEFLELMEDPFEINVMIRNKKHTTDHNDHIIYWTLSKEQWYGELHEKVPKYLELPEKNLILLR